MERMGVLRRVSHCESACGVVLVEQGQQGQDYRLCCNFVELNAHTGECNYPVQDPLHIVDEQREADLWSLLDIKACFHNFPVVPEQQTQLGLVTQDGLWVHERMGFGLELAPKWCQHAMDDILSGTGVPRAKGFFDDVTIPGLRALWRQLWEDTLKVMGALTGAGFMLGLKKCKFLV